MTTIGQLYDSLFDFESRKKKKYYPIHKKINFSNKGYDLVDWFQNNLSFKAKERILDAGCGTGNTLFRLALEKNVIGKGISISKKEIAFANKWILKEGLSNVISFEQKSYDQEFEDKYDKIIAIESLKHSRDIKFTLHNLTSSLLKSGILIISDDFIETKSALVNRQISLWNAYGFVSLKTVVDALNDNNDFEILTHDLTDRVITRPAYLLYPLTYLIQIIRHFFIGKMRLKLGIYLGGLLLEILYKKKETSYYVIIAKKLE